MRSIIALVASLLMIAPTVATAQVTEPLPRVRSGDRSITLRTEPVQIFAAQPTYVASGAGATAYATPTDVLCITGAANKVVKVYAFQLQMAATAATVVNWSFIKRSTANTGGTSTNPAGVPIDSTNAAATAAVTLYTAVPTPGTSVGTVGYVSATAPALASTAGVPISLDTPRSTAEFSQPVVLRGVTQMVCANFGGTAWPSGGIYSWSIRWTETTV